MPIARSSPLLRAPSLIAVCAAIAVVTSLAACGSGSSSSSASACTKTDGAYTLVAKDVAWNTKCLEMSKGQQVTFTVDSRDEVAHNLHITAGKDFKTPLKPGPMTQTLKVQIDKAGTYVFACDIHPNMEGTLRVK